MESSVINKYSSAISKAKESFSYGRDLFSYWNSSRISFLSMIMEKADFYLYLVENKFINTEYVKCLKCAQSMDYRCNASKADGLVWACNNKIGKGIKAEKCKSSRSVRANSWFFKSKLTLQEIVLLTYLWWAKLPAVHIKNEFKFSSRTIVDWNSFCREVAIDVVFNHSEKNGGPGVIVEIDESKFGKSIHCLLLKFVFNN